MPRCENFKLTLLLEPPNGGEMRRACFEIAARYDSPFRPYDLCDSGRGAFVSDGVTADGAAKIDQARQVILARAVNEMLKLIKLEDTENGYPKDHDQPRQHRLRQGPQEDAGTCDRPESQDPKQAHRSG